MQERHPSEDLQVDQMEDNPVTEVFIGGKCGKRLIPNVIDETARLTPDLECMLIPQSNDPSDGWKPVSWSQIANAVNYAAQLLITQVGHPIPGTFPTVAYIGLEDLRYPAFIIGAIKTGYKALLISPRNPVEAQRNLFVETNCNSLFYDSQYATTIQSYVDTKPGMKSIAVVPFEEWIADGVTPVTYTKTFAEAEWDPYVVLHTSGSTGFPKAVVVRQGMMAAYDSHRYIPERNGSLTWLPTWAGFPNPRHLLIMPLFHAAGIMMATVFPFYYNVPIAFRDPNRPITSDNVVKWLQYSNPGWTVIPPAILGQMSHSSEAVNELKKLHMVGTGGGPVPPDPINRLVKLGVRTANLIAATELGFFPYYFRPDPSLWQWFIIPKDVMGIYWRPIDDDVYEQVIVRKGQHPGIQCCFYTFPELKEFSTKDLYRPHPTLEDHWTHIGRADDIIVFSNGEKLNPTTIEAAVAGHPDVLGAQVVGSKKFHAAIMIEPVRYPESEKKKQELLDAVWPTIEQVNKETVAHGRIPHGYVFVSDPERPFPRAGKGTVLRSMVEKLYAEDIERLFEKSEELAMMVDLDLSSEIKLADSLRKLVLQIFEHHELGLDDDFFIAGMDSLQVIQITRTLAASLEKTDTKFRVDKQEIGIRNIYSHPSIRKLAAYLFQETAVRQSAESNALENIQRTNEKKICRALVDKYTCNLPAKIRNKPDPASENQTVIITGTTGALGSYLLDISLKCSSVSKVICFNRGPNGQQRQFKLNSSRGLSTDFSRVEFLQVDLADPNFGLSFEVKDRLANEVDRVIHNAWPVNFNMSVVSFVPQIRGVRNLVDFCAIAARKKVPISFISSIGTVLNWPTPAIPVPEKALSDWSLADIGYSQSKLTSSMILDEAAKISGVPSVIIRVGQIAGPRGKKGKWNPQEWSPSLIRSSVYLGLLPNSLGTLGNIGWASVEDIASIVLEISGVADSRSMEELTGYFHAINPSPVDWPSLIPAVREFYGERIQEVVPLEVWISALEKSQVDTLDIEENPAVKLLDTYRSAAEGVKNGIGASLVDTTRTESYSVTMRHMEKVSPELMKLWCEPWQF